MNWTDLLVIGLIAGMGLIGLKNGFIGSLYKLISSFLAIILAIKLSPVFTKFLAGTQMFAGIKDGIYTNLESKLQTMSEAGNQVTREIFIKNLPLPDFMKASVAGGLPQVNFVNPEVIESISHQLAMMAMDVIGVVLLFILLKIGLSLFGFVLKGVAKLPVFKQVDKLGGFSFGAVAGLLIVYILCAVVMLFNSSPQFEHIFRAIESSTVAKFFYENNFIVDWLLPKTGI